MAFEAIEGVPQTPRIAMSSPPRIPRLDLAARPSSQVSPTTPEFLGPLDEEDHTLAVCQDPHLELDMQQSLMERSMEEPVSQSDSEPPTSPDACCNANSLVNSGGVQSVLQRLQEGQARLADVQGELQEMQIRVLTYVEDKLQEHRECWRMELVEEVGKQVTSVLDTKSSCDRGGQLPVEHGMTKAQLSPSSTCVSLHSEVLQSRTWEHRAAAQERDIERIRADVARHALRFTALEQSLRVTIDSSVEELKRIQSTVNAMLKASDNKAQKPAPVLSHTHSSGTLPQLHAAQHAGVLPMPANKSHECAGDAWFNEGILVPPELSIDWSRLGDSKAQMPTGSATVSTLRTVSGVVSPTLGSPKAMPDRCSDAIPRWHAMTPIERRPLGTAATARISETNAGLEKARIKSSERSSSVPTSPSRVPPLVRESRSLVAPVMPATIPARLAEHCRPSARQVVSRRTNNCPPRLSPSEQEEGGQGHPQEAVGRQSGCQPRLAEGMYLMTAQNSPTAAYRVMTRSTHPVVSPVQMLCHKSPGHRITHPSTPSLRVRNIAGL